MPRKRNIGKQKGRLPGDETTDAPPPKRRTETHVGNISDISGNINVSGREITTHDIATGLSTAEIRQLFEELSSSIDARAETSTAHKEYIKADVKEIQTTVTVAVQRNEPVDEEFLSRRFGNIARLAPDVLDVIVATLGNPLAGLGIAVKKIAEKAKVDVDLSCDAATDVPPPEGKKKKAKGK